jgi:hypothetical protein
MPSLSLVSVNIERSKHLDRVVPFLRAQKPDVVCFQELMVRDIPLFERELGAKSIYVGNTIHPDEGEPDVMGIGIFTAFPIISHATEYYWGGPENVVEFDLTSTKAKHDSENHAVVYCDITKDGATFRIATTHFTWTPNGQPDDFQREDLARMMPILEGAKEFALCGDFNAPRGSEIFTKIAARYKDNIPERYLWSLDLDLHRGGLKHMKEEAAGMGLSGLMVDGLFTTPSYMAENVELHEGVSDHCAITATVAKHV